MASSEKFARSNKNQNIQVFVRLRPLNQREKLIRSLGVVEVVNHREVVVRQSQQTSLTKKFTFDRAFSPDTKQLEVYNEVVSPLIAEVLAGYNCTVFAYGQTGTGKTHTMVGESCPESTSWQNDPLAGIIPRALSQLFDELRISNAEYTVRVSYLELYNEELFDLLAATDDNSKLRIYEDANRKGSTIVNGLEEITVYNKNEVYQIMAQGQERKRVASTLMNAQSSRSHTVFTIVVHIKENCPKGEELVKTGKLNLVDLAGSENISKAGSDNPAKKERARECVNINQSLLTLGRVITALVEKHPHIPYRESKLTRILQESLGGRTKTSIIATISPGHKDLEETMSTLEYAHRAKNIQNKPEVNQKLTKQAILKDFAEEIDKLKRELICTREKNGIYIPTETYMEMQEKHEQQRREIADLILRKRAMEEEKSRMEAVFSEMEATCNHVRRELGDAREELHQTFAKLAETEQQVAEQEHLVSKRAETERHLSSQAQQLVRVATRATGDVGALHDTVDKRKTLESSNQETVSNYRAASAEARSALLNVVNMAAGQYDALRTHLQTSIDDYTRDATMIQENNIQDFKLLVAKMGMFLNEINSAITTSKMEAENGADGCYAALEALTTKRGEALKADLAGLASAAAKALAAADATDLVADVTKRTQSWASEATTHLDSLKTRHSTQGSMARAAAARRAMAGRAHKTQRGQRADQRDQAVQDCIQELEKDKNTIESRIVGLQTMMDTERIETEERLNNWVLEERRLYEERLARHVAEERNALNVRLEKYKAELEAQKELMAQATERCVRLQQLHLAASQEEKDADDAYASQCESEQKECTEQIESYEREFGEDTSKIQTDVEAFTQSLVQVVKSCNDQLMNELHVTLSTVERDCDTMLTKDSVSTEQCLSGARTGLTSVVDSVRRNLAAVADATAETTSTSIARLTDMCARTNELAAATQAHQAGSKESLTSQGATVSRLSAAVGEAVESQAEAEGRYLMREFKVYSPTGQTPSRREYRYPRQLAATSPHDRILQRFREKQRVALPRDSDSDCVVIESDDGKQASDSDGSESTVSEDSAVAMQ